MSHSLLTDLTASIEKWIAGNKSRNLSSLSRKTKVAYSTIRRIMQHEVEPSIVSALAISDVIMTVDEKLVFLKSHYPSLGGVIENFYGNRVKSTNSHTREILSEYLRKEPHNRIFNMAATKCGVSYEQVARLTGEMGIDALNEMLENDLLVEAKNNVYKYHEDNWALFNASDLLTQLRHNVDHVDPKLIGTDGASLVHATGAIKKEKVPEVKKLIVKFANELAALKDNEDSEGNVHFFCGLTYSLYDRKELD